MAALLAPGRQMAHMLAFEAAWSRACGACGLFDAKAAQTAASAIEGAQIDLAEIAAGTAQDGVPVPALVRQLKAIAPAEAVHKGATSQDVIDTALVLILREASQLIDARLDALLIDLEQLETRFGDAPLMGRTRMQAATQITVRDRLRAWSLPLAAHRDRIARLRPLVERVQIGGASGDRKALGDKAGAVVADVARQLDLAPAPHSWHSTRAAIVDHASALSLLSGSLGKMGQDVALMAQQGLDEITLTGGGGSSAMPHKHNPVQAELLVTLARFNATQVSAMHHAMIHEQERSGAAWSLEWMVLPQMLMATARALALGQELARSIGGIGSR